MSVFKDFLLQLTLIAIPMFTYHTFFEGKLSDKHKTMVKTTLWGITIILCMSFSVSIGLDFRFDLRIIPLLLGTLYCGVRMGILLSLLVILYRNYIGLDIGFYHTVFSMLLSVPVIFYFQKRFINASKAKRLLLSFFLSTYYSIMVVLCFYLLSPAISVQNVIELTIFLLFSVITTWFFTMLNENIREVHRYRLEIQNTEKLKLLRDLTSSFAHEIRNPMQVNRGFLQLIEEEEIPERLKGYIDLCIKEMDRANEIINDYLSFAKPQFESLESINVSQQLHQIKNIIHPYALSNGVEIKMNTEDNLFVLADSQKFKQCFINLIKNGVEAMPDGGDIYITCFSLDDTSLQIEIVDHGVGMTHEQVKKLGTPFYTLKDKGTGLGLMVTYRIIQSFNGSIQVSSQVGRGSQFLITLPREVPVTTRNLSNAIELI